MTYGLEQINEDVSRWMLGGPEPPENLVYSQDSVVWNRSYSRYVDARIHSALERRAGSLRL